MLVYIHSNYDSPNLLRQTPLLNGVWDNIEFTYNEVSECDYIIVINHPTKDIHVKCRKGGRILLIQEPPYQRNNYLIPFFPYFDTIITAFDKKHSANIIHTPAALPWLIDKNYDELMELENLTNEKKEEISWVTSNSNVNPGHEPRLNFLEVLKKSDLNVDLFGRGIKSIANKFDALYPYKYSLAIENYAGENYWTEKITDAYLSWTMPIYYGCTNMADFFPEHSFISINIHQPVEAIEIIKKSMQDKVYDKNLNAIKKARDLILNKYQFFPFFTDFFAKQALENSPYINCFIPQSPPVNGLVNKIKSLLKK